MGEGNWNDYGLCDMLWGRVTGMIGGDMLWGEGNWNDNIWSCVICYGFSRVTGMIMV